MVLRVSSADKSTLGLSNLLQGWQLLSVCCNRPGCCRNDVIPAGMTSMTYGYFFLQDGCEQTSVFNCPWQLVLLLRSRFLLPEFRYLSEAPERCAPAKGIQLFEGLRFSLLMSLSSLAAWGWRPPTIII